MSNEAGDPNDDENGSNSFKTPMWQIGQLARYHKLNPVYKLEKEDPKKKAKRFTVSLTLDKEVWTGHGNTKKHAKQNAANKAIKGTSFTLPTSSKKTTVNPNALTATVKLNGWAMANRKQVTYSLCEKRYIPVINQYNMQQQQLLAMPLPYQMHENPYLFPMNGFSTIENNISNSHPTSPMSMPFKKPTYFQVCVQVEDEKFFGEGPTQQAARHDAANNALSTLAKNYSVPIVENGIAENKEAKPLSSQKKEQNPSKTSVCLLNEEVLARNMSIVFNVLEEKGPPHLKCYTLEVVAGHFTNQKLDEKRAHFKAVASGTSKKAARQVAASQILKEIREQFPPKEKPPPKIDKGPLKGHQPPASVLHPVSRLMQICQAQKIKPPSYSLIEESSEKHSGNTFTMKCCLNEKSVTATGKSKKDAKRAAADAMLIEIRQELKLNEVPNKDMLPQKSSLKPKDLTIDMDKRLKVKFMDDGVCS